MTADRQKKDAIPHFLLYGEEDVLSDADFIHIEDIPSRSSRHGWDIAPHTHRGLFQVLLVTKGRVREVAWEIRTGR